VLFFPGSRSGPIRAMDSGIVRNLSGNDYRAGLRCAALLWKRRRDSAGDGVKRRGWVAGLDEARVIGGFARRLHAGGREIAAADPGEAAALTAALLPQRIPLHGAVFHGGGGTARIDLLIPDKVDGGWRLARVRNGAAVRHAHLEDLAFQWHVSAVAGLPVTGCSVIHVNSQYRRAGEIDPAGLLRERDVSDAVRAKLAAVAAQLEQMATVAAGESCPRTPIGPQCLHGTGCAYREECWAFLPEHPVTDLSGDHAGLRWRLLASGILRMADIPDDAELSAKQRIQREAVRAGCAYRDEAVLSAFLGRLRWPLAFLDVEALSSPVPWYEGTSPFEEVPVQFSLHIQHEPCGPLEHHEFLAEGPDDPRPALSAALRAGLPAEGSIVAYHAPLERRCLRAAAGASCWEKRLVDLMDPFRGFAWHGAGQHGGISLKQVFPAVTGRSHAGLRIKDGLAAARAFAAAEFGSLSAEARQEVRAALRDYCRTDTLAMAGVVDALGTAARAAGS